MIRRVPWCQEAEVGLRVSANGGVGFLRRDVEAGAAQLWECASERHHAFVLTRLERNATGGPEVLIECFEGSGVKEFVPIFLNAARAHGCTIRAEVQRAGLVRMLAPMGFEHSHYMLRAQ